MDIVLEELLEELNCHSDEGPIQNFVSVEKLLFDLFASPHGYVSMLITHYYVTSRNSDTPFLIDIMEQNKWLKVSKPYFSALAKNFRLLRNALTHKTFLKTLILKRTASALITFIRKGTQVKELVEIIISKLCIILKIILGKEEVNPFCPCCGQLLKQEIRKVKTMTLNEIPLEKEEKVESKEKKVESNEEKVESNEEKVESKEEKVESKEEKVESNEEKVKNENPISMQEITTLSISDIKGVHSLGWYKTNYKNELKGLRIRVLDRKWENKEFTFRRWCGTVGDIVSDEGKVVKINNDRLIEIISSTNSNIRKEPTQPEEKIHENTDVVHSLKWFKDNGFRDKLKGMKVRICDGANQGLEAYFNSWSGTMAIITYCSSGQRKTIRIDTKVSLIE